MSLHGQVDHISAWYNANPYVCAATPAIDSELDKVMTAIWDDGAPSSSSTFLFSVLLTLGVIDSMARGAIWSSRRVKLQVGSFGGGSVFDHECYFSVSGITAERDLLLVLDNCIITVNELCVTIDLYILRTGYVNPFFQLESTLSKTEAAVTSGHRGHRADHDRHPLVLHSHQRTVYLRRSTPTIVLLPPLAVTTAINTGSFRCCRVPLASKWWIFVHFQSTRRLIMGSPLLVGLSIYDNVGPCRSFQRLIISYSGLPCIHPFLLQNNSNTTRSFRIRLVFPSLACSRRRDKMLMTCACESPI